MRTSFFRAGRNRGARAPLLARFYVGEGSSFPFGSQGVSVGAVEALLK